jgi:hypothetical protein
MKAVAFCAWKITLERTERCGEDLSKIIRELLLISRQFSRLLRG